MSRIALVVLAAALVILLPECGRAQQIDVPVSPLWEPYPMKGATIAPLKLVTTVKTDAAGQTVTTTSLAVIPQQSRALGDLAVGSSIVGFFKGQGTADMPVVGLRLTWSAAGLGWTQKAASRDYAVPVTIVPKGQPLAFRLEGAKLSILPGATVVPLPSPVVVPPPIVPPPAGTARRLFASGFEGATAIAPLNQVNFWGTGGFSDIVGIDNTTGFTWPPSIWGGGGARFLYLTDPLNVAAVDLGGFMLNRIEAVAGPKGDQTRALFQQISRNVNGTEPMGTSPTTTVFELHPTGETSDLYVSYWLKFQPDMLQKMTNLPNGPGVINGGTWRAFFALKTGTQRPNQGALNAPFDDGDYRIEAYVMTYDSQTLYWQVLADNNAGGGAAMVNNWVIQNRTLPVPVGEWFKFEFFLHRSNGADGRTWAAVNGNVIADRRGPNMGERNLPINRIMAPTLYTGSRMPVYQWVDDLEIWNGFPGSVVPVPDTQAPTVPTELAAVALSPTQVKLTWNASTDNVGVTGYWVYLNDVKLAETTDTTFTHSGLTPGATYNYRVSARDAVPNHSAWTAVPVSITTPAAVPVAGDFATRCAAPGVIRCVGFDSPADIAGTSTSNTGIVPSVGANGTTPALDLSVAASGASSLKFTILSNSSADTSGSYFANFSPDLSVLFGADSEFYVQWRQRFSPEFLSTIYTGSDGWKQAIIGTGDKPGARYFSCTDPEVVIVNTYQRGFAQGYNSCSGSASHSAFFPFEEPLGSSDFKLQNARPAPGCLLSQGTAGRQGPGANCLLYYPNEWMTFQVRVKTGARVGDEWANSSVTLWIAREGKPSEKAIEFPINLSAGDPALDQKFGKIWFLPYNTRKDPAQQHPTAYTWYDELIISRSQIADPGSMPVVIPGTTPPEPVVTPGTSAPPGTSMLGKLAASMTSGQWAPLPGFSTSMVTAQGPSTPTILGFAARGQWDTVHRRLQFAGTSHTGGVVIAGAGGLITYDDDTNTWVRETYAWNVYDPGHAYYHVALNKRTGDLYYRQFNAPRIYKRAYGASGQAAWQTGQVADHPNRANQVAGGLEWFPQLNGGAGGLVFVDTFGACWSNAALSAWLCGPTLALGQIHNWIAAAGGFVYFGGGGGSSAMYRLSTAGVVTPMPDTPLGAGVNDNAAIVLAHPNGKDLLLFGTAAGGPVHRFDGASWIAAGAHQLGGQLWVGITVPEYGVIVFLRHENVGTGAGSAMVFKP